VSLMTAQAMIRRREFGFDSAGYLAPAPLEGHPELGEWMGRPSEVKAVWEKLKPEILAVGMEERRGQLPVGQLLDLRLSSARIEDVSIVFETLTGRVPLRSLKPSALIFTSDLGPHPGQIRRQVLYSQVIAIAGIALTLPVMILAWLAVRLTSRGPAVYSQVRTGLGGRPFKVLKFRSMYVDAESRTGAVWATRDDPRITPVGRWLRKLRIDELPQFFNVLKGEMAIVGPRPERPEFVAALSEKIPFYGRRHAVMPGITGWAQINYRYSESFEDTATKLEYDLYYIKHMSMSLDFYIMMQTAKVMLLSRGAQ
jgi:exopolysaccharide biosynthesis polyprenyl glycosylphosphotransferase